VPLLGHQARARPDKKSPECAIARVIVTCPR
jgi:hypothetical protein